ncbi:hypothetical protein K469DRAFT_749406 [Zopfia rhizophila CBS 207.26]|uniref:Uncharacterized protein n=1 Tax=Zopfia rhizophila CBS 207.26 TaxID=1314779 RepID=A0A6A6E886_9PEZI|nr:hypothetical protein K469DRAFT_749406 [Zopfia rhizophila CBS 207.26]
MKRLDLEIKHSGDIGFSNQLVFEWRRGDMFPYPEELKLRGYDYDSDENGIHAEHKVGQWGGGLGAMRDEAYERERGKNMRRWRRRMNWEMLRKLGFNRLSDWFAEAFTGELKRLESLRIRPKIEFGGRESTLCGDDKETKRLREVYYKRRAVEGAACGEYEESLEFSEIETIRKLAPNLKKLEIDTPRAPGETFDDAVLEQLILFKELEELMIHLNIFHSYGTKLSKICDFLGFLSHIPIKEPLEPLINSTLASRDFSKFQDTKLEKLTVMVGDIRNKDYWGHLMRGYGWADVGNGGALVEGGWQ